MSSQTTFDLIGLTRAIELCDPDYQVALYADDAEVRILEQDFPDSSVCLRGKSAIRDWINSMASTKVRHRVRDPIATPDRVSFSEECEYSDGTHVTFTFSADSRRGQIVKALVTVAHPAV